MPYSRVVGAPNSKPDYFLDFALIQRGYIDLTSFLQDTDIEPVVHDIHVVLLELLLVQTFVHYSASAASISALSVVYL